MLGYVLGLTLVLTALSPLIFTDAYADSFNVNFNKQFYDLGDALIVSGEILDGTMPIIAMSIYDPDGKILSANNLEIMTENTFSKTISLDSPSYEKTGEYLVKLDYGQESENHYFVILGEIIESEIFIDETVVPEIILLYTEKKQYTDKDVIEITGLVSTMDFPTVLIGIYDPFGMPAGFYFGSINSNLEFSTSFLVKDGVNFRVDGTYSVKAHYAESEVTSFFEYHKVLQIIDEEDFPKDNTNESLIEDEKTNEPNVDITSENDITPSSEQQNDNSQNDTNLIDDSSIISTEKTESNKNVVVKNIVDDDSAKKTNILENKKTDSIKEKPIIQNKNKKENNLTVEDIELGMILNQIKLECDSSTYTDTIFYYDGMGPALYRLCNFESSLNFFNESLTNNPNDLEILVNKGSTLGKLGYFTEAIAYYDHAIAINPDFFPAKNNKANALANLGNFNDAVFLYDEILEQNPNYLTARKNLEIILSSNFDLQDNSSKTNAENISYTQPPLTEKTNPENSKNQKSSNFFDEVGIVFSTFGSLFGFLN